MQRWKKGEGGELTGTKDKEITRKKALQFSLFDFAFLVGKECSRNAGCAW